MQAISSKKRIGILRGGIEGDYHASLREGGEIISHIFEHLNDKWKVVDIFIDKEGIWHVGGLKIDIPDLHQRVDLVWNVAHPGLGNLLDKLSIPNINVSSFSSLLRDNHEMLRSHLKEIGLVMPRKIVLPVYQADIDGGMEMYALKKAKEVWQKFPAPWVVRSFTEDATMGIHIAKTFPQLMDSILDGMFHKKSILVEEFIIGEEISTHSVKGFRNQDVYVFPVGKTSSVHKEKLEQLSRDLHQHLGINHYLKSDFVVHSKKGIFITNISFLPDLKQGSDFEQATDSVGAKMHHVIEHLLDRALSTN